MNTYPALTISLLSQLTNRELQSNYLNHLDRTAEIASLLTQITDPDLALRIVNLALEVDLCLGAKLTASLAKPLGTRIEPALQQIIVDGIDRLEIPTRLKISLWHKTKSKAALPYLQDIFIYNHQRPNTWEGHREIESATSTIIQIDRDLAVALLIEELNHPHRYHRAAEILADLAPVETIGALGDLLQTGDRRNLNAECNSIQALIEIGTEASIAKLREVLHTCKDRWSDDEWIQGLGYIADPAMVEHLIDLLYEPALYTERSGNIYETDRPCSEAILALEHIGGEKVFDWLHQAMYWISADDEFRSPFHIIVQTLFRLDSDRALTAIEGAIQSYDPVVRKRAAMALVVWDVPIVDRNLSILLNAIDDPDLDVQIKIVCGIREIIHLSTYSYNPLNIAPELIDQAILAAQPIALKYINHPDIEIREQAIENNIGSLSPNMLRLGEIGSDLAIHPIQKIIKSHAYDYCDEPEDGIRSLATIGTDAAKMALLEILTERPNLGRSVFNVFSDDGKLGIVPRLWSAHYQTYFDGGLDAVSKIQEREGLYNPDFSDRSHPLFEPPRRRLRDILLGNTTPEI